MSLSNLVVGKQMLPPRVCIYGNHGIGKSTLASQFPAPIFINTEDGLDSLDVTSFPRAQVIDDVVENIKALLKEEHEFKTLVIDSVDWLVEPLISTNVEENNTKADLAYGKAQMMVAEEFREILQGLDALRRKKGMNIVLLAHAAVTRFESPLTEPYDRYQPKLPNRANALLQEWCDVIAYAGFRVIVKKADVGFNNQVARGVTTGERLLHVTENPAYVAKNRYGCPDTFEMTYEEVIKNIPVQS
ncbi:phage_P_loop, phage nucleotide-binding protein [uncultured Caudovirales phage]|uniref:Phage_P_loop, phage nucleotide-binding protein n=1 Tax=uncultured Caudovirales phage TaxID=2100421 RepID=A0A6J5LG23_9CAUD|nr:phage_P_loop, phage nucleotide-binding protein [uncultured Caudovirales phage]